MEQPVPACSRQSRTAACVLASAPVHPQQRITALTGIDEADNRILEAAEAFRADCLVTGDRHLLNLEKYHGIPILTPRQFLTRFKVE